MKSGRTRRGNQPVDWVDLIARIRAGDDEGVSRFREIFQDAIRHFLRGAIGQHQLEFRQNEVIALLIARIRDNSNGDPNRLASYVLTMLRQYIGSQIKSSPHLVADTESDS